MRRHKDYCASLRRWYPWQPSFQFEKRYRLGWYVYWRGPAGGRHRNFGFTRWGARRVAMREIAGWTRKLRRAENDW